MSEAPIPTIDDIEIGQRWVAHQNPYPAKGYPNQQPPWDIGTIVEVVSINRMGGKYEPLVAFDGPKDGEQWEVSLSTFANGFQRIEGTA
jgi:hypothetical protein